jgi:hypothetical protein
MRPINERLKSTTNHSQGDNGSSLGFSDGGASYWLYVEQPKRKNWLTGKNEELPAKTVRAAKFPAHPPHPRNRIYKPTVFNNSIINFLWVRKDEKCCQWHPLGRF